MPSFQDYLKNSEITGCVYLMFASIIPGLKSATQKTIDWMKSEPRFAAAAAMIGRYWDDIGSHEVISPILRSFYNEIDIFVIGG